MEKTIYQICSGLTLEIWTDKKAIASTEKRVKKCYNNMVQCGNLLEYDRLGKKWHQYLKELYNLQEPVKVSLVKIVDKNTKIHTDIL